jgi:pilus assembly protein Flp/PilA
MSFWPKENGQGIVEYALILALIAVAVILIFSILGTSVGNVFKNIMTNM